MINLFLKRLYSRRLARIGARQRKEAYEAKRRAIVDDMREKMGMDKWRWQ